LLDIPKLEQLIFSRLRHLINTRIVYPNHISVALPRFLSPNVSAEPLISDFGDAAVEAMGDAFREGIGRMVGDLSETLSGTVEEQSTNSALSDEEERVNRGGLPAGSVKESKVLARGITQRKITMPSGFPGSSLTNSSNTPLATPGVVPDMRRPPQPTSPEVSYRSSPSIASSRIPTRLPQPTPHGGLPSDARKAPSHASSFAPGVPDREGFRFRGQFAGSSASQTEEHSMGVLNSRAS
jgi:maintenance of morphology protein 1